MAQTTIANDEFRRYMAWRVRGLLRLCVCLAQHPGTNHTLSRPMLGELLSQSSVIEDLLAEYGANHNQQWFPLRSLTAAIKLFSSLRNELLHIKH